MTWAPREDVRAARRALDELNDHPGEHFSYPEHENEVAALALLALHPLQRWWVSTTWPAGRR